MASADADRLAGPAAAHQGSDRRLAVAGGNAWLCGVEKVAAGRQRGSCSGRDARGAAHGAELNLAVFDEIIPEGTRALDMRGSRRPRRTPQCGTILILRHRRTPPNLNRLVTENISPDSKF